MGSILEVCIFGAWQGSERRRTLSRPGVGVSHLLGVADCAGVSVSQACTDHTVEGGTRPQRMVVGFGAEKARRRRARVPAQTCASPGADVGASVAAQTWARRSRRRRALVPAQMWASRSRRRPYQPCGSLPCPLRRPNGAAWSREAPAPPPISRARTDPDRQPEHADGTGRPALARPAPWRSPRPRSPPLASSSRRSPPSRPASPARACHAGDAPHRRS